MSTAVDPARMDDLGHARRGASLVARNRRWRPPTTLLLILALSAIVSYYVFRGSRFSVYLLNTTLLACIGALALALLMGTCGQVSIGNSAFLAAGGFAAAWSMRSGIQFPYSVIVAMAVCAVVGFLVGLPALRIRGIYLALATLAAFFVVMYVVTKYQGNTVGAGAFVFEHPFGGKAEERNKTWAWVLLAIVAVTLLIVTWLRTGRTGRAWRMIRDHEVAAPMMGIPVARYKLIAFVISSAVIGMQGALTAYFVGSLSYEAFTLGLAISYIAMILIGGADSQAGPLIGAAIVTTMPTFVPELVRVIAGSSVSAVHTAAYSQIAYGALIILFIVYSPRGVNGWLVELASATRRIVRRRRERSSPEFTSR